MLPGSGMTDFLSTCRKATRRSKPAECRNHGAQCRKGLGLLMSMALLLACPLVFPQQASPSLGEAQRVGSETSADGTEALQKATQNTVASVLSVPVEEKVNFNMGPHNRNQNIISIKPLIPVQISQHWRVVARIIQPIQWQPYVEQRRGAEVGLGDMNPTFFLSPAHWGTLTWGVGPTFIVPTATNRILGQGKFSMGPALAVFVQPGHWTYGTLISNVWSVAGSGGRANINQMQLQYFLSYRLKKGWDIEASPVVTANWNARGGDIWTVPFGGGVGKIVHLGPRPAKISAQFYGNAVHPPGASPWNMRLQTEFLFPKRGKEQEN